MDSSLRTVSTLSCSTVPSINLKYFKVIGQFPDFFSAAVMRNPVISVGEMFATTDIPDWTLAELGEKYDPARVLTPELYQKLYTASPIAHIEAVKTPVLLLLGDVDRR